MRPSTLRSAPAAALALLVAACTASPHSGTATAVVRPGGLAGQAAVAAPNAAPPAARRAAPTRPAAPRLRARSAIVIDLGDGTVLFARRAGRPRPQGV